MAAPTAAVRSYKDLFANPSKCPLGIGDPMKSAIGNIYAHWRVDAGPPDVDEVHEDLLSDFVWAIGAVGVFTSATPDEPTGALKLLHGFLRHPGLPGQASAHRNVTFAYLGDIVGLDIQSVAFDENQLERTDEVNVAGSPARHQELLQADPDEEQVGPFAAGGANMKTVRTRGMMCIPFPLVQHVLGKDLTARQAWDVLYPAITTAGMEHECNNLLEFLMVAATKPTEAAPEPLTLAAHVGQTGYPIEAEVISHRRTKVLWEQLPDLKPDPSTPAGDPALVQLVTAVVELSENNREDREDRKAQRERSALPKTPRERWGDRLTDKLLKMCAVVRDDDLPTIYHEIAAKPKGVTDLMALQQEVDAMAEATGCNTFYATPQQAGCFKNLTFFGNNEHELGNGVLPFSVTPPGATSNAAQKQLADDLARAEQYNMSGEAVNGALSASDARSMRNPKGYIPINWAEANSQIKCYKPLLATVLGERHPNVTAHDNAYQCYEKIESRFQFELDNAYGKAAPAVFVCHWQLYHKNWFEEQWSNNGVLITEPPTLTDGFRAFKLNRNLSWLPIISDIPSISRLRPTVPSRGAGNNNPGGGNNDDRAAPANAGNPGRERVQNPNRDRRFTGNTPLGVTVRGRGVREALTTAGRPPPEVTRNGVRMQSCVSWHAKGTCFSNCDRIADHVAHTPGEATEFFEWCQAAFA